jgi:nucleotide-binding universal stress UspA family protein
MGAEREQKGEIITAINFDDLAAGLVRVSAALAAASHRTLRLAHVFSPEYIGIADFYPDARERWEGRAERWDEGWAAPYLGPPGRYTVGRRVDPSMDQAESYLSALAAAEAGSGVITHTTVLTGEFPDALADFAATSNASLLVVGAPVHRPGILKARLRPTLRLMATSPIPVLAVADPAAKLTLQDKALRVLVADDLTPTSLPAIDAAAELLETVQAPVDVLHLHVEPLPPPGFNAAFDPELAVWPGISIKERLLDDHLEQLQNRLVMRGTPLATRAVATGGKYSAELWQGQVARELKRAVQMHGADLVVFGRHHFLHRQPLALGQMPFPSMLGLGSAVMVAAGP